MNALAEVRADIVAALTAADIGKVHDHVPGRLTPPCVVVIPGSPYVEKAAGDTFASHTVRFEAWLIAGQGPNDATTAGLDERIATAVSALAADGLDVSRVDEPFLYQIQNANYLAATLNVAATVTFTNN